MRSSLEEHLCLTYVCDTDERDEERGDHDEEREELSMFVQELEFVDESRDHRLHPSHLKNSVQMQLQRCGSSGLSFISYSSEPH